MYTYLIKEGVRFRFLTESNDVELRHFLARQGISAISVAWRKGKLPADIGKLIAKNVPGVFIAWNHTHRFIASSNQFLRICNDIGLTITSPPERWQESECAYYPLNPKEGAYVYILRAGDYCKVGYSCDIKARIKQLQISCPHRIELLAYRRCLYPTKHSKAKDIEQMIHTELQPHRKASEWFKVTRPQFDVIVKKYELTVNPNCLVDEVNSETGELRPDQRWLPTQFEIDLELDYQEKLKAIDEVYRSKLDRMQAELEGEPAEDGSWIESPAVLKPMKFNLNYEPKCILAP